MSKRNQEHDGNAMASAAAFRQQLIRSGELLLRAERIFERCWDEDVFVRNVNIKLDGGGGGNYLAIVKAETPEGKIVAFHDAPTLLELVTGLLARLENKSLKWREDTPYEPR